MTGIGKNAGVEVGWCDACGAAATPPDAEAVAEAAAPNDDADTKGGDNATIKDGELPSAATAGPCDG